MMDLDGKGFFPGDGEPAPSSRQAPILSKASILWISLRSFKKGEMDACGPQAATGGEEMCRGLFLGNWAIPLSWVVWSSFGRFKKMKGFMGQSEVGRAVR
ncbi:hypothetical protein Droror1_Dr00006124 [Drosera rotundifolia]